MVLAGCIWRSVENITFDFDVREDEVDPERELIGARFQMILDCVSESTDCLEVDSDSDSGRPLKFIVSLLLDGEVAELGGVKVKIVQ
jgi:hypothetical protein